MAIIGETLVAPEDGFTRYEFINKDDLTLNNEYFYSITASIIRDNNGLLAVGVSNGDEILVKIKNTSNFRLLVCLPDSTNANTLYTNNMVVEIDEVKHTYDLTSNQNATIIDNCLVVDINNLSANNHIIKIYADGNNNDTQMINVQAIDIDEGGVIGFTRAMASMFEGCTSLKKDIIIPKNADIVENMFKNCTSMTHVHSNWDKTYNDSGIIAEDCYSGCTSITHIDGVALNLNEYTKGLDDVPPEWGGYGYSREYTGIYMLEILTPNYTFSFASDGLLDNKYINWGDGTITQNEYSHTYVSAGVYIIKGQVHSTAQTVTDSMKLCLKEIIQYPIYGNLYYAFTGCTTLVDANISGNKYYDSNQSRSNVFQDCINLETVIALDTKLEKTTSHISAFQGCKKLRGVIGIGDFIYNTQNITSLFNDCPLLLDLTIPEDSLKNCKDATSAFCSCTSLTESPIKTFDVPNISRIFEGCTNITDISGVTFGKNITITDMWYPPKLTTVNNVTIKNENNVVNFRNCTYLTECNNLTLTDNVTDISGLFSGCSSLKQDIIIPSHITNCSEMFKGCTSMTHIHSNWDNEYNGDIISTDCYSGCTKITHIDGEKVITYEGDSGIDYVPSEWGGNGFNKSNTTVLRINLTSDNYNVRISVMNQNNGITSWGDGTADDSPSHTYSTAGTYILKTKKLINTSLADVTLRSVLTDVLGLSNNTNHREGHYFRDCPKLKTINMDDYILKNSPKNPFLQGTRNVEYISAKNVTIKSSGFGCFSSVFAAKTTNNALTEIVGIDTWKIETNDLSCLFRGFAKLESLNISNWNLENVTNMSNMFEFCESLTESPIENFPNSVTNISNMFKGCISLTQDIEIPSHITNCSGMFKNCTSMTHVRSNWDEIYDDSGIITEDCYSGCTSITHIDDVALSLNEYTNGLDNIPPEWGGYGFSREYTGIYTVEIPSSNYTFSFASDGLLDNKYINWGDGTITQNEYSHTYVNVGIYTIKGNVHSTAQTVTDSMKLCLKEIIQYPIYGNLYYAFTNCTTLVSANISGNKYPNSRAYAFQNCTNLETVTALDTKLETMLKHFSAFQNCKKLREVIGIGDFIYNTQNASGLFNTCPSLLNLTIPEDSLKKNCLSIASAFSKCTSLTESPIKTFVVSNISKIFEGCTNITDISDVTFLEKITTADMWYPPKLTTVNNVTIKNKNNVVNFRNCTYLTECNNLTLADNVTDISGLFSGCSSLKQDIEIPSHITNCSEMFKNCTSMTHIRSNWDNNYTGRITTTDCYSGCTAITHIDDEKVTTYNGDTALDYVPIEWGGHGLIDDGTVSIYEVTIPSDNFTLQLFKYSYAFSRRDDDMDTLSLDNHITWGDGESYTNDYTGGLTEFPKHTYAKAGVYYIKGHFGKFGNSISPMAGAYAFLEAAVNCITGILKPAYRGYCSSTRKYSPAMNLRNAFKGLSALKSVSNFKISNEITSLYGLFKDCTSLVSVDFSGCDTRNVTDMASMFQGCSSLTSLDLSNFNTGNVTDMEAVFGGCNSLEKIILPNMNVGESKNLYFAFEGCPNLRTIQGKIENFHSHEEMFRGSHNIETITGGMDFSKDFNAAHLCSSTTNTKLVNLTITGSYNINAGTNIYMWQQFPSLSAESLVQLLNALVDLRGQSSKNLVLGSTNLAKLSTSQIKIATDKNWTLV